MPIAHHPRETRRRLLLFRQMELAAVLLLMTAGAAQARPPRNQVLPMDWEPLNFDHCGSTFECAGSLGHYEDDARQWREFRFDGVKIDWCGGRNDGRGMHRHLCRVRRGCIGDDPFGLVVLSVEFGILNQPTPWRKPSAFCVLPTAF
jgi:hypothetical protein